MRIAFWASAIMAGAFTVLAGAYVEYWREDAFPLNMVSSASG